MMDEMLLEKIDRAINDCRQQLAQDIIDLIAVRSVQGPPQPGAPFGIGPKAMLDAVVKLGEREGFSSTRYTDSVIGLAA